MKYTPRRFIQLMWSYRPTQLASLARHYRALELKDPHHIAQAKRLHAAVYLERAYVSKQDIAYGMIKKSSDPYQEHSIYFGVIDNVTNTVVAVARQIHHDDKTTFLPIFRHVLKDYNGPYVNPKNTIEISAFTKRRGIDSRVLLLLFRAMLHASKRAGQDRWYLSCDSYIYGNLKLLFGRVLQPIGPSVYYMGSWVIPVMINITTAPIQLKLSYQLALPPLRQVRRFLYASLSDVLEPIHIPVWVKLSAGGTLVFWSLIKAGLVWGMFGAAGVNTIIFLCIDIVTIPLYVLGITGCIEALSAKKWRSATFFTAMTLLAFGLPYAYMYIAGGGRMSGRLLVSFIVFVLVFFAIGPIRTIITGIKLHRGGMSNTIDT